MMDRSTWKFVRLRLFGRGNGRFYLWGVYANDQRVWLASIETEATSAGYMASAIAHHMGLHLELAGQEQ